MKDKALKLALEAIEEIHRTGDTQVFDMYYAKPAIAAIKEALAQAEYKSGFVDSKLSPIQRTWMGLTGVEINHIFAANVGYPERMMNEVAKLLKERNT